MLTYKVIVVIQAGMSNPEGKPRIFKSPEAFDLMVDIYVENCKLTKEPLTITGVALALGFCAKQTLYDYGSKENMPEFHDSVKRARLLVEQSYEKRLSGTTAAGSIFALKNMNWSDRQDLQVGDIHITISNKDAQL